MLGNSSTARGSQDHPTTFVKAHVDRDATIGPTHQRRHSPAELSDGRAANLRHRPIHLVLEQPQDVIDAFLSCGRQAVQRRSAEQDGVLAEDEGLYDVGASAVAAVDRIGAEIRDRVSARMSSGETAAWSWRPPWLGGSHHRRLPRRSARRLRTHDALHSAIAPFPAAVEDVFKNAQAIHQLPKQVLDLYEGGSWSSPRPEFSPS